MLTRRIELKATQAALEEAVVCVLTLSEKLSSASDALVEAARLIAALEDANLSNLRTMAEIAEAFKRYADNPSSDVSEDVGKILWEVRHMVARAEEHVVGE